MEHALGWYTLIKKSDRVFRSDVVRSLTRNNILLSCLKHGKTAFN